MPEKYEIAVEDGRVSFSMLAGDIPEALIRGVQLPDNYSVFCRLGDPDLLECVVWRHELEHGGVFVVRAAGEPLFAASARSALAFSLAVGYFGDLTAKARYGADIFENMDSGHD